MGVRGDHLPDDRREHLIAAASTGPARPGSREAAGPTSFSREKGRGRRAGAAIGLLLAALAPSGCYRTVPLEGAAPVPGALVRVELTREGSLRMTDLIGAGVASVEGRTVAVRADAWELALTGTQLQSGNEVRWNGEAVALPAAYIESAGARRLERVRTGVAAAAVVVGALLATHLFQAGAAGEDDDDDGGEPAG